MRTLIALTCLAPVVLAQDPDSDGDGLSDFQERHKYGTDPARADSDGDGAPDGGWDERREYAYTVRSVIQVLRPVTLDVLCDDYQDARVLAETPEYVELEVVHYPLNTVADAIVGARDWRAGHAGLEAYLAPGRTANWDEELRATLLAELRADGIDVERLTDKEVVEQVTPWLLRRAESHNCFTTFVTSFDEDGRPRLHPGLEAAASGGLAPGATSFEEHWQREFFARGMFLNRARGTCTSSAIYLDGCLRAVGIPTRIVLTMPAVDGSDPAEVAMLAGLEHVGVREILESAVGRLGRSWANHTFNEVWIGGRWRRLNYDRLGQNILDEQFFGLMTHIATFSDWSDGDMASTWGVRQTHRRFSNDTFGGANPYHALSIEDAFGAHAKVPNAFLDEAFRALTIERAYWHHERPEEVGMAVQEDGSGHCFVHVREGRPGEYSGQYARFYGRASKAFLLRAEGHADVRLAAERGYVADPANGLSEFYLRIPPDELVHMAPGVAYTLAAPAQDETYRWSFAGEVTLTLDAARAPAPLPEPPSELAIESVVWSDRCAGPAPELDVPVLLARVGASEEFPAVKRFTQLADRRFFLEAPGHPTLAVGCRVGGFTSAAGCFVMIDLGPADWRDLVQGVAYALRPRNAQEGHRWAVAEGLEVLR